MSTLAGKHVLLGITGGIAAYKLPFLVRLLRAQEAEVRVLMTPAATSFVTPLTLAALSGQPVHHHLVEEEPGQTAWNNHVAHAEWADLMIMAPATANTLAKAVQGLCDNLVMATYLSAKCPILWAPSMDLDMFAHPSTQQNLSTLASWGHVLMASPSGPLASGLHGAGRMAEPEDIASQAIRILCTTPYWKNKTVILTSGPTQEPLDPIRFVSNGSSGRMGTALARALSAKGASIHWVHGPQQVFEAHLPGVTYYSVKTAKEMHSVVQGLQGESDIFIASAAVADFRPERVFEEKQKKSGGMAATAWVENPDILLHVGQSKKPHQRVLGFALESTWNVEEARAKAARKGADAIVLNQAGDLQGGMHTETNRIALLTQEETYDFPVAHKDAIGEALVHWMESHWNL